MGKIRRAASKNKAWQTIFTELRDFSVCSSATGSGLSTANWNIQRQDKSSNFANTIPLSCSMNKFRTGTVLTSSMVGETMPFTIEIKPDKIGRINS